MQSTPPSLCLIFLAISLLFWFLLSVPFFSLSFNGTRGGGGGLSKNIGNHLIMYRGFINTAGAAVRTTLFHSQKKTIVVKDDLKILAKTFYFHSR